MARDARQRDIVPPEKLEELHAIVVGVGAVGKQCALQLASTGITSMVLIDPDSVEEVNLGPQGYSPHNVGDAKVWVTESLVKYLNPDIEVLVCQERFRQSNVLPKYVAANKNTILFSCVDDIEARNVIWEGCRKFVSFFVDARVGSEVIRVLPVTDPLKDEYYTTTLFKKEEAHTGACTAKMTIFLANLAAGMMLSQWSKWLREMPVDRDVFFNTLSSEMWIG